VDQTQRDILVEIDELTKQIEADLDSLRATEINGQTRRDLIARIFRSVHTIKGSAASCDLEAVSRITHEFEHLLVEVRAGRVTIDAAVLSAAEKAARALSESGRIAASGSVQPSRDALFAQLQSAAQTNATGSSLNSEAILESVPSEIRQSLTELEKQQLLTIVAEGSPLFVVASSFDIRTFDAEFFRLKEELSRFGEIISTSPAVDDKQLDKIKFQILYASNADLAALFARNSDFSNVVLKEILNAAEPEETESATSPSVSSRLQFVRTDLDKLDSIIAATHELFRTTSTTLTFAASKMSGSASDEFHKLENLICNSFTNLEDELIRLRLAQLGPTLDRVARAGRAAARVADKDIEFEIAGSEIRLDKVLVEAIANPLIQLVRNAVDHGIETATERGSAGKQTRGVVRIEAINDGSQARLRVSDDGRGVDPQFISAAAKRLGLLKTDAELSVEQSLRLIFRPGFTTLAAASELSGRGVGLDVVETSVEQLGGELRVSSTPGLGTTFEILLPVTFGVMASNVVVSAGNRYCIPALQTLGIDAIDIVDGSSGANQLRQVSLRDLLGQPDEETEDLTAPLQLITCEYRDEHAGAGDLQAKYVGIVVDRVEGPQEVLVRSLGQHAGRWYGIAGATELQDGTVALVLDLPRLLGSA
jgi:two-component system chemotaxis sensor kinase CheA